MASGLSKSSYSTSAYHDGRRSSSSSSSQNISAYSGTPVIAFNKQVAKDFGTDNFYEVMNNGDWTIDYIIEVSKDIISDVDGTGEYDFNDMYGFISNNFMVDCMIGGSGYKMVAKGSDD